MIKVDDICKSNKSDYQFYKVLEVENGYASCLGYDGYRYTIPLDDLETVNKGEDMFIKK